MAVNLSPVGGVAAQFFDNSGNVLTGGKLLTYLAGTTTPAVTYTTSAGTIPQPNPIILNASGRVPGSGEIWLTDGILYKFVLTDSNDVLIATYDNITGINSNFINFTNQQEIQTATAGQTVFNLATVQYLPGTNSLSVFVDGVNQYGPGAQYAYIETDQDTVTFVNGLHVGALVKFTTSQLNSAAAADAEQVSYLPPFTGSVATNVEAKLAQYVSIKDFGAIGNGVANDTAAFTAAIAYIESTGTPIFVPPGTYLTDPFQIDATAYSSQGFFYGLEAASTIIRRRTTGASAFITVGNPAGAIFQANLVFSNLTLDGGVTTNGDTCVFYDVVRSRCENITFTGGAVALHSYGGIVVTFSDCIFQNALRGFVAEKFTSSAGGGWPNLLRLDNCAIVDNDTWGIWFDYGRMLVVEGCQIEGNGTTLAATEGGVYIGPNVGEEVAITDPLSIGLVLEACWLEANYGVADIYLNSGLNSVQDSNFFSQSTMVTNDIRIDGGRYRFKNLNMSFGKTPNVLENAGAGIGNMMEFVQAASLSYSSQKTMINNGWQAFIGNGAIPGINGATAPLILTGSDVTSATPTITFSQAFKSGTTPKIYVQAISDSPGVSLTIDAYAITNSGFTMRKKSNGSNTNFTVDWMAVGENP